MHRPTSLDQSFVDFDSVRYHLSTPSRKSLLVLSMDVPCWAELKAYGARDVLEREYGARLLPEDRTEEGYSLTLEVDLEQGPAEGEERTALINSLALLKRNALAAPFERAFALQREMEESPVEDGAKDPRGEVMSVHYRPEEAIYLLPSSDRVTVIFSTIFKEETDRILGKVFLQEFVDARRRPSCQTAPQVLYSNREPPLEIRHLKGLDMTERAGYVTFVLFPRHFTQQSYASTITQIQLFRDSLHYNIKCSKAYLHSRMRVRTSGFLKVLNRAKPEQQDEGERKTASGRTFVRS
ncbi:actin-related protein 2/3 complex subunit 2 [Rhodotorula diobovata]|uniref:Arp2/3 complex 34 kDa subunit n=1 Tax=Rhodotorula diobovata TaxID=5288 RepID=A0A5C5FUL5_9BASI|nr:actin-related protein 2/3 complex subunit 2 [Rhodotorula diobovata]